LPGHGLVDVQDWIQIEEVTARTLVKLKISARYSDTSLPSNRNNSRSPYAIDIKDFRRLGRVAMLSLLALGDGLPKGLAMRWSVPSGSPARPERTMSARRPVSTKSPIS
jgi:hypothetical protein